ncbi:hypothetical protein JSO56_04995 [Riemerella anatipestifer]|uniref:hypothetical protein n=1 Tax=Riemerella anatipestifer TaxID=34085 RepID=UPI0030BAA6D4
MNSNTVEFVLRMRDLMSSGVNKLSSTTQSAFTRMSQYADRANQRNKVLGMSFDELQKQIKTVENTIRTSTIPSQINQAKRELASLQRQARNHSGNLGGGNQKMSSSIGIGGVAIGTMLGGAASQVGGAILGVLKDGAGAAIGGSIKKEQQLTGLATFLGKDGAAEAYKNIQKDASISPFGTDALLSVNRSLISAGLNAKDAREDTMNLANAISAVGGGNVELDRMAANMQQIKTVGKATATDIRQFGMVGINIYEMLSRSTGKTIEQVKNMDVTYDELAKSLAMARGKGGIYEGALEAMGETRGAKIEQIKDKFQMALTQVGDAFSPIITKLLDVGIKFVDSIEPAMVRIQPYIDMVSNGLGLAIDYVLNLSSGTGEWVSWVEILGDWYFTVWDFLKNILSSVWVIVSGVVQWIGKSEIIKDLIRGIHWLFGQVFNVVSWIGDKLVWIWNNVLQPILDGIETAYRWVKDFASDDKPLQIEATKKIIEDKPTDNNVPSYFADLTRFKGGGGGSTIDETEKKTKGNKERSQKTGETISGGGPRTVNITLGKFFDTIQFTTMNGEESAEKLQSVVMECLARVLYNGGKTA